MKCKKPNIVLINCDDLGYGDLGCYGSKLNNTPVLDKMADEGMKFTSFYMASSLCSPSRGAMLTGCYPRRIGFGSFDDEGVLFPGQGLGLHPEEITIASILKDADYRTMLVGKWHCGDQPEFLPLNHGFDHYYGLPYSNDMGVQARRINQKVFPPLPLMRDHEVIQEQPDQASLTERYVEQGVRFIRDNKEKPFFLYFAHMHVHLPLYAPERFLKNSKNGDYGATVECIDWATGVIIDELKRQQLEENTLIIFTSDNGSNEKCGGSNYPLRGTKCTTWEGGMRVPCIMYWPGIISPGKVCDELVTSMDFFTTIAKFTGQSIPQARVIDGIDISSLIFGEQNKTCLREAFFYYLYDNLEAVRSGKWKLHVRKGDKKVRELYDLDQDIGESNNLYDKYPEIVSRLEEYLDNARADLGDASEDVEGENTRPLGRCQNPDTLTHYNEDHPYIIALYDKEDYG